MMSKAMQSKGMAFGHRMIGAANAMASTKESIMLRKPLKFCLTADASCSQMSLGRMRSMSTPNKLVMMMLRSEPRMNSASSHSG